MKNKKISNVMRTVPFANDKPVLRDLGMLAHLSFYKLIFRIKRISDHYRSPPRDPREIESGTLLTTVAFGLLGQQTRDGTIQLLSQPILMMSIVTFPP